MNVLKLLLDRTNFMIFFIIIWDTLKFYLGLDAAIYQFLILLPVLFLGLTDNISSPLFWKTISSRPGSVWLIWIIFALLNTFFITGFFHPNSQSPFVFISAIVITFLFFIVIISKKYSTKSLIIVMQLAFAVRLIISFIFDSSSIQGSDTVARFGSEFNSNAIAFGALFYIILMIIKKIQFNKTHIIEYAFAIVSIATILLTASKKNFLTLVFVILSYLVIKRSKNVIKNIILGFISFGLVAILGFWTLNNTGIGTRILHTFEKSANAESTDKMFDHRMSYYINGWEFFKENPINGIGLINFPYRNNSTHVLHTEYMVQLTENGIIGTSLFILFYGYIIKHLLKIRISACINQRRTAEVYLLGILVMFILFFGSWIYNNPLMWVLIALAVRFIRQSKNNIKKLRQNYAKITVNG
ncbi:MAG: O-antigen ligase [Olleya marilimosa]|jgi:O-antigen ligase|uniref:O-antigen ligase family protein n=1 Tax=Olleya marilimosa TaxID=272164 RepID=UPI000483C726|nr:O-antigen ligase family protein [Olleya marilimosa]